MKNFPKLAGLLLLGMASQGASAYNWLQCNDGSALFAGDGNQSFNYGVNLFDDEKTAFNAAFDRLEYFSQGVITGVDNGDASYSFPNGQNEVYFLSTVGTADCTYQYYLAPNCSVIEADIRLGDEPWYDDGEDSNHWPYGTSGRSVHGVAVHEGGHCIGLGHTNNLYNIMGQEWTHVTRNRTTTFYGPGEDASDGLIDLHGERSTTDAYNDLGASVWRFDPVATGTSAYSSHKPGVLRNSSGTVLPTSGSYVGQTAYRVQPGQTIQFEHTLEAIGELNTVSFDIGFYLSGNDNIATCCVDTLFFEQSTSMSRGAPWERTTTMTLPGADVMTPGNWFVGAYIDHTSSIAEYTHANNVAYYPVVVPPADLIVQSPSVSDNTLNPGQPFTVYATARNIGAGGSPATTLRYYRSPDANITTGDNQIGTDPVSALSAGSASGESATVSAPGVGAFYIGACVDTVTGESNTTNQCSAGVLIQVTTPPPSVTTIPATVITQDSARLKAIVNPDGTATKVYFDYGTTTAYGTSVGYGNIGSGTSGVNVTKSISGLTCGTTYHYRARASNAGGMGYGINRTFTTEDCPGC